MKKTQRFDRIDDHLGRVCDDLIQTLFAPRAWIQVCWLVCMIEYDREQCRF